MPSAGDPINLQPNLTMLAQLAGKPGAKLSYNPSSGQFPIDENTRYQGVARFLWRVLPVGNDSVCHSFTVDWARRILVGRKSNWGISKRLPEARPITLDRHQKERIMSKVTGKIAPLQAELESYPKGQWANRIDDVMSSNERFSKYADLKIESIISTSHPKKIAPNWSGSDFVSEVLRI
jgi:hypothetical protein